MITLSNLWCWIRGKPPKWKHLNLNEVFPLIADMTPAGGEPPPRMITPIQVQPDEGLFVVHRKCCRVWPLAGGNPVQRCGLCGEVPTEEATKEEYDNQKPFDMNRISPFRVDL